MAKGNRNSASADFEAEEILAFEEWRMKKNVTQTQEGPFLVTIVKLSRLEKLRDKVVISQEEADVLNVGSAAPSAINPVMYLRSDEDLEKFTSKVYPKLQ